VLVTACAADPPADPSTDIVAPPPPTTEPPSASTAPLPPPASGVALEIYPPPPIGHPSRAFRVRVGGKPAYVERYGGVSYVRFAFEGNVDVDIDVDAPIATHRVLPADAVSASTQTGKTLRLSLPEPARVVVWVDGLEKLFVLADPIEAAPVAGTDGVASVADFGAAANAPGVATAAIQSAIDAASTRPGGGTVLFPPGRYVAGTLRVKSNVTLYLAAGALLEGSPDPGDYPIDPGRVERGTDTTLGADARFFGRNMTFSRLLLVDQASNARIRGRGTIDGQGSFLRQQHDAVPNLIRVRESQDVTIEDVMFRDSAAWTVHLLASKGVLLRNVKVLNDRTNLDADGIDPDMSTDVTIDRAFIYTKADAVCLKATRNGELAGDVARVKVTNSVVSSLEAALKLGTESIAARFDDVVFDNDWVFESGRAMSIVVRDGALYDKVAFRNIHVDRGVDHLVEQVIGVRDPEAALGSVRGLAFEDVTAPSFVKPASNWTSYAQFRPTRPAAGSPNVPVFEGAGADHPLDGLLFRNVVVNGVHLTSADVARTVAGLAIGPFVTGVVFE
jgi:polygalacturonase